MGNARINALYAELVSLHFFEFENCWSYLIEFISRLSGFGPGWLPSFSSCSNFDVVVVFFVATKVCNSIFELFRPKSRFV